MLCFTLGTHIPNYLSKRLNNGIFDDDTRKYGYKLKIKIVVRSV